MRILLPPLFSSQSLEKRCDGLRESRTAIATTLIAVVQGVLDGCGVDLRICGDLQSVRVLCAPPGSGSHFVASVLLSGRNRWEQKLCIGSQEPGLGGDLTPLFSPTVALRIFIVGYRLHLHE